MSIERTQNDPTKTTIAVERLVTGDQYCWSTAGVEQIATLRSSAVISEDNVVRWSAGGYSFQAPYGTIVEILEY